MITEPMTMLTDYVLAAICAYFALTLERRARRAGGRKVGLWVAAFAITGFAALAGGTAHGFRILLGESFPIVWSVTVWSIAGGSLLLIAAGARSALAPETEGEPRREGLVFLKGAVGVTLAGLAVLVGRLSLHEHFNQNDLYHLIQMAGLYLLYRGALLLHGISGFDRLRETAR